MYNLLISGHEDSWEGEPWVIEASRCVREYTDDEITTRYGSLDASAIHKLKTLPSIFAYEVGINKNPKFGRITSIEKIGDQVTITYLIEKLPSFLTVEAIKNLEAELGFGRLEHYRSHWAVKPINLPALMARLAVPLPPWASLSEAVNISVHNFEVALSFPGPVRPYVETIAGELERIMGPDSYFYDNNYVAQLARPSLDTLLQDIYRNRAKLIVVFLSGAYQTRPWCGVEFRAIKEIILHRQHDRVMFVKMDDGEVEGVFDTDGYVDGRIHSPATVAQFIWERVALLE